MTAVLIIGNHPYAASPLWREREHSFRNEITEILAGLGYTVTHTHGHDAELIPMADVWVAHDRGCQVLCKAPRHTKCVVIDDYLKDGHVDKQGNLHPSHFKVTQALRDALLKLG